MYLLRCACQLRMGGSVPAMPAPEPPPMRERYRAHVRHEVKQAALRQLAESGPAGLSVSAIGKQLGVSGPALYRYFAGRDELLTELVIDAHDDLADALRAAASQPAGPEPRPRFEALAPVYPAWAREPPARPGEPGNRRELRVHGHRSRPGLRGATGRAHRVKTRLSATPACWRPPGPVRQPASATLQRLPEPPAIHRAAIPAPRTRRY